MDRATLESLLEEGHSLAEIGRRCGGKHESTVAYWLARYGLPAAWAERHRAKGALTREQLEGLVAAGSSIATIAQETGRSKATVRHWLARYGLTTAQARRKNAGRQQTMSVCRTHGTTRFSVRPDGGYRCLACRSEAVSRRRRQIKETLVLEAGGACSRCGYEGCVSALEFHHLDPAEKVVGLSQGGMTMSLARARVEAAKCSLLCANCHAEVEGEARGRRSSADSFRTLL